VNDRPEIIKKLENKSREMLRDRQLIAQAANKDGVNNSDKSALAEYENLVKDSNVPTGIRYLALHCIADKNGFYNDPRDKSQAIGTVSQEMGGLVPGDVVGAIQYLKIQYPFIYHLNEPFFDRYEAHAIGFITRLPVEQQDKTVAQSRDTQLKPIPINPERLPTPPLSQPVAPNAIPTPLPDEADRYEPTMSKVFNDPLPTAIPASVPTQKQNNSNKGAFIIGGGIVLAALIFKMLPSQQNAQQSQQPTQIDRNNNPVNISPSTSSQQPESTPIMSPPTVKPPTPVAVSRPSTDNFISEYYSKIKSGQTSSAWNDLSSDYQNNSQANPGGYGGEYVKWWGGLGRNTQVSRIETVNVNPDSATVHARCRFQGNSYTVRYHLVFDNSSQSWKINKIDKL
jgi:hypothetical protein